MAYREYIGSRYVPIFGRKGETTTEWDNLAPYEPLTVVTHEGNSYISRQYVPTGIDIDNREYWVESGNYNAQIEAYRQEVLTFDGRIDALEDNFPIQTADIANGAITADKLADNAVTQAKIADDAVTTDKLVDNAVTQAKIADDAVTTDKLVDNAVTQEKIAEGAVTSTRLATGAVTSSKIADTAVHYEALNSELKHSIDVINTLANLSFLHKNVITIGDSFGRGTGAGESGHPNDQGWPYYINSFLRPEFFLNVSNSAAGFIRGGHTDPYNGMNFLQMATYAKNNQLGDVSANAIDLIIIGGGVNDYQQENFANAAYTTTRGIQSLYPNAQIYYFPLAAGDMTMDESHYNALSQLCYGCAEGGAQVFNNAMWWLYPYETRTSFGDGLHPNQQGYHFIGSFMAASLSGTYLTDSIYFGSTYATDGLVMDSGVTNVNFTAQCMNNAAWYGGSCKRTGTGDICTLPTYCRPAHAKQFLAYVYANATHQGAARMYVNASTGKLSFFAMLDSSQYDASLEYTIFIPIQYCPFGHLAG